ncbi:MAG TPA: hypothetical protein P5044_02395 [bacterium]|nr:hypothetical protein [bacterium]
MSKKKKLIIKLSILALAVLVTVIYELRPEKDMSEKLLPEKYQGRDAISEMGDISKSEPVKETAEAQKTVPIDNKDDAEQADDDKKEPVKASEKFKKANESISDSYQKHGEKVVLKAADKLNEKEKKHGSYDIVEPDFSRLHPLTFGGLKKVYTYFRIKESLPAEVVEKLNGAAVVMTGAVMPVDKIPEDGNFSAFWLSNPSIVLAGCVFCNPPTLADVVYVYKDRGETPFKVEREKLFKQVVLVRVIGRLFFGPEKRGDQTFLFSILVTDVELLN